MKKNNKKKNAVFTVFLIIILIILLLILGAFITVNHFMNKINRANPDEISVIPPDIVATDTDDEEYIDPNESLVEESTGCFDTDDIDSKTDCPITDAPVTSGGKTDPTLTELHDEDLLNILFVGQDSSSYTKRTRTDSMILLSVNTKTGKITLTSFLRDIYVVIPRGYTSNRLNVPYKYGGFPLLYETFEDNFGVHIDYGVAVNFDGFTKIIDILGGVDITLTDGEYEWLKNYKDIVPGLNHFNGELALEYARIRHIDNDFKRTERQRKVVLAVYNKFKSASLSTLLEAVDSVLPYILTDMSNSEIISTAMTLYKFIGNGYTTHSIPAVGTFKNATVGKKAVLKIDYEATRRKLLEYLPLD